MKGYKYAPIDSTGRDLVIKYFLFLQIEEVEEDLKFILFLRCTRKKNGYH